MQLLCEKIPKVQKDSQLKLLFALSGFAGVKAARKHVDENPRWAICDPRSAYFRPQVQKPCFDEDDEMSEKNQEKSVKRDERRSHFRQMATTAKKGMRREESPNCFVLNIFCIFCCNLFLLPPPSYIFSQYYIKSQVFATLFVCRLGGVNLTNILRDVFFA